MVESKHTPKLELVEGITHRILSTGETLWEWDLFDETEHHKATVYGDKHLAHKMATAPVLLDALEDLAKQVGKLPATQGEGWGRMVAALCEAQVAITLAKGENEHA